MKHIGLTEKCNIFIVMYNKLLVISQSLGSLSLFHNCFYALKMSLTSGSSNVLCSRHFADFFLTMTSNVWTISGSLWISVTFSVHSHSAELFSHTLCAEFDRCLSSARDGRAHLETLHHRRMSRIKGTKSLLCWWRKKNWVKKLIRRYHDLLKALRCTSLV